MTDGLRLSDLAEAAETAERLVGVGLGEQAAAGKAAGIARAARALRDAGAPPDGPVRAFYVPGRIEVLGKHTDYAGGRSLLAAAERGFCLLAVPRDDAAVRIADAAGGGQAAFDLRDDLHAPAGHWCNYPMTVARRIARNFPGRLCGADVAFVSDLPVAAGMSSSSAMMVAFYLALAAVNDLSGRPEYLRDVNSPEDLAGYLGAVENGQTFGSLQGDRGVGTFGGSEDHTAMLCCRAGRLCQYSYRPVRFERALAMPPGYVFAVAASGVAAEKTSGAMEKYNRASRQAAAVAGAWNDATGRNDPHIAAALASGEDAAAEICRVLRDAGPPAGEELLRRFEHFLAESEQIVPAAGDALDRGDVDAFARQVERSQQLAETLLGNQVPETIHLAASARRLGAAAASAFGAGFGGSVWAMVPAAGADEMLAEWARRYRDVYAPAAERASFFLTAPGPGAAELA